jgi:hypothetical protein
MLFRLFNRASVSLIAAAAGLGACASAGDPAVPSSALSVPTHGELSIINAELKGVIERDGTCLRLRDSGGGLHTPIWPVGTVLEGNSVRLPAGPATLGAAARIGSRVRLLGTRELPPSAVKPAGCGTNFFAVVQLKS